MMVGVYVEELAYSNRQAGVLASVEAVGMSLASILGIFWVKRFNWRLIALIGLGCSIIANLLATGVNEFTAMLFCRGFASLAAGTAFAVSVASLGEQKKPEKAFGGALAVQTFLMIIIMGSSAAVIERQGVDGLFYMLALLALAVALPTAWLPVRSEKSLDIKVQSSPDSSSGRAWIFVALIATALHFAGTVGFWAYLERIGDSAGHSTATIGTILAWALGAGMLGGLLAAWLSDRWGFAWPFVISTIILVASVGLMVGDINISLMALGAIAFDGMWVFANTYQAALVARLDKAGRFIVLVPAAQGAGAMAGPAIAAMFVRSDNYLPVNILAGTCFVISLFLFLLALRGLSASKSGRKYYE